MDACKLASFEASVLQLVKERLDRLPEDTAKDEYYKARIKATIAEIERTGIVLEDTYDDLMLTVDYTVWASQNRDKTAGMPDWLRLRRRERWLSQRAT